MKRLLGSLLVALAGCVAPASPRPPQVPASMVEQEQLIHTIRAQFKASIKTPTTERNASGVLLVQKPDRFRVRMSSAFGMTVMDYLSVGRRTRLDLPVNQKLLFDAAVDEGSAFHAADLRAAFLRGPDAYPPPCRLTEGTEETHLDCGPRRVTLRHGDLVNESETDAEGVRLTASYDDIRTVDGIRLPFAITMEYPREGMKLAVTVVRYEVNPVFSEELFRAGEWPPP